MARALWEFTWLFFFRPTPRWAFHSWRNFLLRIFGAKVGPHCRIDPSCRIWAPWNLTLKGYTSLGSGVDCYTMDKITIGTKTSISQRSFICSGSHEIGTLDRRLITKSIVIGDHAWIAAESFIHPGVEIGEGSVIGARSVVTKDMPPWMICSGNPCKPIKERKITH